MQSNSIVQEFSKLIQSRSGIRVAEHRDHLLRNRAEMRMESLQIRDLRTYFELVMRESSGNELGTLIDSIATNFTSFFRDSRQFDILTEELTALVRKGVHPIRIWSAACSTGQEVYSIAICALEVSRRMGIHKNRFRILGTDISTHALNFADNACYNETEIAQLDDKYRGYFKRDNIQTDSWRLNKEIRDMVVLRQMNLCDNSWKLSNAIDCIFLRNVLIYFEPDVQTSILDRSASKLKSGGLLFLGACESKRAQLENLQYLAPAVFRRELSNPGIGGRHD